MTAKPDIEIRCQFPCGHVVDWPERFPGRPITFFDIARGRFECPVCVSESIRKGFGIFGDESAAEWEIIPACR